MIVPVRRRRRSRSSKISEIIRMYYRAMLIGKAFDKNAQFLPHSIINRSKESNATLAGMESVTLQPRLLDSEDEHGLRQDISTAAGSQGLDEYRLYQDMWFGSLVGEQQGDDRWMSELHSTTRDVGRACRSQAK